MIELIEISESNIDYDLIHDWCKNKFVYEWFEQRILSKEEIKQKYSNKLFNSQQKLFYISCNNKYIGLVQYYLSDYKFGNNEKIYEYDLYIGDSEYLSKGIGKEIIKKVNKIIFEKEIANRIILRPFTRNTRACKCYEKCGFTKINEYNDFDTIGNKENYSVYIIDKSLYF